MINSVTKFSLLALMVLSSACNPIYVTKAAYQEAKILLARQPIEQVLQQPNIDQETAFKLKLTLASRAYAESCGLTPKQAYTSYSDIGKEDLSWIVMGARPYSFELATWWFPIVGNVPYRGFFEKDEATEFAKDLENKEYETWVRPTDAFSTLGWFNDPILSTTLKHPAYAVVNTVLHELFHNTIWMKDNVTWNESAANFFAQYATIEFFNKQIEKCSAEQCSDMNTLNTELASAKDALETEILLADSITKLHTALEELYNDKQKDKATILAEREQVFSENVKDFREHFPKARALKTINNAEILALKTYLTGFPEFKTQIESCNLDLACFIEKLKQKLNS